MSSENAAAALDDVTATVRTFKAKDARTALASVKAALGPDAVILSTQELPGTFLRRPQIEVTAALPSSGPVKAAGLRAYGKQASTPSEQDSAGDATASREGSEPRFTRAESRPSRDDLPEPRGMPGSKTAKNASVTKPSASEERQSAMDAYTSNKDWATLNAALEEMRKEIRQLSGHSRAARELQISPNAAALYGQLVTRGVEEALAEELVREALAAVGGGEHGALVDAVRKNLNERLVPARAPWLADRRRIIALVGPTGVGKTTTLAKMAARAITDSKLKVAMITVDTYRIGAAEQITRYGEIMRVPTFVARDRGELLKAVDKAASADLVLIDTAGRSMSEAVARQAELIRTVPGTQLYLTLSAATGWRELKSQAERYRSLNPARLIFTKLDETDCPGGVLSAAMKVSRPVACLTHGQRVPEDIYAPSLSELDDLVVGTGVSGGSFDNLTMGRV